MTVVYTHKMITDAVKREGSQRKAANALGLAQASVSRALTFCRDVTVERAADSGNAVTRPKTPVARPKAASKAACHAGISGFKALFSPSQRGHDALASLIAGPLQVRGWIYDSEMRELAKIDSVAWTNLRRDYENLLVEVRDPDTRTRKTVWCHPDIVDEAREIAKERSR